ncbi:M14 family zinc carboxypeptidase [Bacillus sp. EB01]|uniref:M14 family zinc carboxypeptidase n=1 Tax=Bacillus sp. EB01 TaxID=1347086 RepID=UPI000B324D7F|nr:M14 family zinc carboxypeptidase [Bacillus sp. EB01]
MRKVKLFIIAAIFMFSGFMFPENGRAAGIIVNPNQVYSFGDMITDMYKLKSAYPGLIQVKVIGKSEYGRNLYAIGLGKGSANVFVNGSHHAREWMTTTLNMYMINHYAEAYTKNTSIGGYNARTILNQTTLWFVPMINPDGVKLQQEGLKAFPQSMHASLKKMNEGSTNFKRWKANAKGVDLNRQYNAGWKALKGPTAPRYKDFKGYAPQSAAETKAVIKFVNGINPEMAVSYHSSGKILYWKYSQTGSQYTRDHTYAKKIGSLTGYRLVYPQGIPSGGGFTDWFTSYKKRPGFTPEISKPVYETNPPLSEFAGAWRENQAVGLYVAQESAKLYNDRLFAQLKPKFVQLTIDSRKLRPYYYSEVKTVADLKITKAHTDFYNSLSSQNKSLTSQAAKLPSSYRTKLATYQKEINAHITNSGNFIAGVKAGDALLAQQKVLNDKLTAGALDTGIAAMHKKLIDSTGATSRAVTKMAWASVRSLANTKYIVPATITKDNTLYEIKRYGLTSEIEQLLQPENLPVVKEKLAQLDQLEIEAAAYKKAMNAEYPGKFYSFPATESLLKSKKDAIIAWIAETEASAGQINSDADTETP